MKLDQGPLARQSTKGPTLYRFVATPEGTPKVVVGLLHGYADYAARYTHVAEAWTERGIAVVGIDMRGHGRAEGLRSIRRVPRRRGRAHAPGG
jgi:alpha-beta hydrolase superfamily lysophospholipase